jgi:hypothetical protein
MTASAIALITLAILAGGLGLAGRRQGPQAPFRLQVAMALGTGFTLAMLGLELLPETREIAEHHGQGAWAAMAATALGVGLLDRWVGPLLTRWLDPPTAHGHHHDHHHGACSHHDSGLGHGAACSAVGCLLICLFVDGAALNASQAASATVSALVSLSLVLHLLPEALFCVTMMQAAGAAPQTVTRTAWLAAAAFAAGGLLPLQILPAQHLLIPAAAGILLMVNVIHLLPAVNVSRSARWQVLAGAGVFWLIERLLSLSHHAHG